MSAQINFKKGSVEMLLLHVLSCKGDCYGYQLSQLIKKSSGGELDFPVGSRPVQNDRSRIYLGLQTTGRQTPSAGLLPSGRRRLAAAGRPEAGILCHLSQHSAGFKQ